VAREDVRRQMTALAQRWEASGETQVVFAQRHGLTEGKLRYWLQRAKRPQAKPALLYSLVQSCSLVDIPPFDYLKDVLLRVATHPQRRIGELTPKGWAATFRRDVAA
jgi:IS66 C-terminal element